MCDERRATVTTVDLEGSRPAQRVSLTLTKAQLYIGIAAQSITILTAAVLVALWLGRIMVHQEFERAIGEFHKIARPQLEQVMDKKILEHYREAEAEYQTEQKVLLQRLATLESHAGSTDQRLQRIEDKIDRLLAR